MPPGLILELIDFVVALNLQQGIENSLDAKLDSALAALEDINNNNDVAAVNSLQGEFSRRVTGLSDAFTELRVYVEAALDFPEEEIDFLAADEVRLQLDDLVEQFDELFSALRVRDGTHHQGPLLRPQLLRCLRFLCTAVRGRD